MFVREVVWGEVEVSRVRNTDQLVMEEVTEKVKCDMAELGLRLWMHRNGSWPFLGLFFCLAFRLPCKHDRWSVAWAHSQGSRKADGAWGLIQIPNTILGVLKKRAVLQCIPYFLGDMNDIVMLQAFLPVVGGSIPWSCPKGSLYCICTLFISIFIWEGELLRLRKNFC